MLRPAASANLGAAVDAMLRFLLLALLLVHGAIHLMGLAKAWDWGPVAAIAKPVSRAQGLLWGAAAILFLVALALVIRHRDTWWVPAAAGAAVSQALIILHWSDARFGTYANAAILLAAVLGAAVWSLRNGYADGTSAAVQRALAEPQRMVAESDMTGLPPPVQRLLRAHGAVGRPRPRVLRMELSGELRGADGPWMPFTSVQVNTFGEPTRHFWIDAVMKGLPTKGHHAYAGGHARMHIKLLGLVTVMDHSGDRMDASETVTWLNDLCLFAPGALVDPRMSWTPIADDRARVTFTHGARSVSAELVIDEEGRLVDFISDDRYCLMPDGRMEPLRFTTPCSKHRHVNGRLVPGYGEAIWHLAEGPFSYGRFTLRSCSVE